MYEWQVVALVTSRIHQEKVRAHGTVKVSRAGKSGWSIRDTAKFLKISVGKVSEDIRLANLMSRKPAVIKIKHREDAIILLRNRRK
jgi:hypothetical protein